MIEIIIATVSGGILVIAGVLLGAYLAHRLIKADPRNDSLFGPTPKGEVFSIDDMGEEPEEEEREKNIPEAIQERSNEFIKQFAEGMK